MAKRIYPSYFIYKDDAGEYRWRFQASNGKIIADSGEGYKRKADCRRGIDIMRGTAGAPIWRASDVEAG